MKEWFKYEFGYVNIDSEDLYLTNSGNWSETINLSENTTKVKIGNSFKKIKFIGFILVVVGFLLYQIIENNINSKLGIGLLISITALGYRLYKYFKSEIGECFKIPLNKIQKISINKSSIAITYINGEGIESAQEIALVEEKGLIIMKQLKANQSN